MHLKRVLISFHTLEPLFSSSKSIYFCSVNERLFDMTHPGQPSSSGLPIALFCWSCNITNYAIILGIYCSFLTIYTKMAYIGPAEIWFNSLWPSDAIWWHRSGSILTQVMAWCLMAPSHYLVQCWLIIKDVCMQPNTDKCKSHGIYSM